MLTGSEDSPRLMGCSWGNLRGRVQVRVHGKHQYLHRLHTTVIWLLGRYVTKARDSPKEVISVNSSSTKSYELHIARRVGMQPTKLVEA